MNADTLPLLGGFWLVHLAAVASPGPSFVVVSRTAVSRSSGDAVAVAAGLAVGTLAWACAAWFGLTLLFALVPALCNEFGWYSVVALALSRPGVRRRYLAAKATIDRVTGAVLAGLGTRLLLTD